MKFQKILSGTIKFIFSLCLFFPIISYANNVLSVTATSSFPAAMFTSSTSTASYTIKNISTIAVTVVNKSQFPAGMTVTSNTCGTLNAGQSCTMALQFQSPSASQSISTSLSVWAMPTADGVESPISINVATPIIVTPSAGTGGTISPTSVPSLFSGSNVTFTATPSTNYIVNQWLVDGNVVQTGGTTYTLSNITTNHSVSVTFTGPLTVIPSAGVGGTISPNTAQTVTSGNSLTFTGTPASGRRVNQWLLDGSLAQTGGVTYQLSNIVTNHAVAVSFIQQFTVTPSAGANGTITPNTSQLVDSGSSITFTASAASGYGVNQWLLDGTPVQNGGATYTLNNVTANHTVQSTFISQFTITPSADANSSITPSTAQLVNNGSSITFTGAAASGYLINQWLVDGSVVQTGGTTYTLSNITADHTIALTSIQQFTVTPSADANSSITPSTVQTVTSGSNITFTATAVSGYDINQWLVDGSIVQTGGTTYTLSNITANHTVAVTSIQQFTVTPSADANSSISPSTAQTVDSGGSIIFTATAASGYTINQWLVDNVLVQTGGTTYTLNNITANHTIAVTSLPQFTVTPTADAGGTMTPNTAQSVTSGNSITFTATPDPQNLVNQWLVDGAVVQTGGATYTLNNVTADHTVEVNFTASFTITPSAGTGGTISPSAVQIVTNGDNASFTAAPSSQYLINQWLVDGVVVQTGGTTYTLSNVTANHTIDVTFTAPFTITPSASAGGAISPGTPQLIISGNSFTFTATPITGYGVTEWLVDGSSVQTGGTSYTFSNVTAAHSVTVNFALLYTVTPTAGTNGSISPNTASIVTSGSSLTYTATPAAQYAVSQWLVDGAVVQNGGATYTLNNVTANHAINVTFIAANLMASGFDSTNNLALVATSMDGGSTWGVPAISSNVNAILQSSSCTGNGSAGVCIASGCLATASPPPTTCAAVSSGGGPFLVASTDGGTSWAPQTITSTQALLGASCTGKASTDLGTNAICVTSGGDGSSNPLMIVYNSSLGAWTNKSIGNLTDPALIEAVSCTGDGTNAICIAAGQDTSTSAPLLAVSIDGAAVTWNAVSIPSIPLTGYFNGASCTGSGSSMICVATGQSFSEGKPLLVVGTNGGATWNVVTTIGGFTDTGVLYAASCTGSGSTAICTAVGQDTNNNLPLIVVSTDGGTTWSVATITSFADEGIFYGTNCTGSGSTAICTAAGQDTITGLPLLVSSINGGGTWSLVTVPSLTDQGSFYATTCTGSVCIAAGHDDILNAPLLVKSINGSQAWSMATITNLPTNGGFNGTGASNMTLKGLRAHHT